MKSFNMNPDQLTTARLNLKLITEADYPDIYHVHSFPEVDRYNTLGIPDSVEDTIRIMTPLVEGNKTGANYVYGVRLKENDAFVGLVGIKFSAPKYKAAEVWYKYVPDVWGKGLATEVLKEIIGFCFNHLKMHRVEAGCAVDNVGSIRVLEKVGMQLEGRRRKTLPLKDGWSDNFEYAILDSDPLDYMP